MSPLEVRILLHYWYSPEDFDDHMEAPAQTEIHARFVALGLLEYREGQVPRFRGVTDALRPYVEAVLDIPLPVKKWILP